MKTTLYQKFESFEELNKHSDKGVFPNRILRFIQYVRIAGEYKIVVYVHENKNIGCCVCFCVKENDPITGKKIISPIISSGYSKFFFNYPLVKKHLPENWNGECGEYHKGIKLKNLSDVA
jgi:hypothetical protein